MKAAPNVDGAGFRVLCLIPPMTQLNTPYPASAYLTGFLRSRGIDARQDDLALKLVLELFSVAGLTQLRACALKLEEAQRSAAVNQFLDHLCFNIIFKISFQDVPRNFSRPKSFDLGLFTLKLQMFF